MSRASFAAYLAELPVFERREETVSAHCYNHARLALRRFGNPARITLANLRSLDLVLEDKLWVCVDNSLDDLPVLAWMKFAVKGRNALHHPVRCELRFYHSHAGAIRDQVLERMTQCISERLAAN